MPSRITLNANGDPEVLRLEQVQACLFNTTDPADEI
ncbi:hypothetical protein, partial [Pseudomonas aeruginosa]